MSTLKYAVRSAVEWKGHNRWLTFLEQTPGMPAVAAKDRTLVERYQHRFIHLGLSRAQKLEILYAHYLFASQSFPSHLFSKLYHERTANLGAVILRDGSELNLVLKAPELRGHEGELSIYLQNAQGQRLSFATVTFADGGKTLLIGCIQGATSGAGREAIRELTKQCHGLRPKNLLLSAIHALAEGFGVQRIRAVGNANHPFARIANKIKADYDGFWTESGGIAAPDGFFDLPLYEEKRLEADVESKHRSAFRKREALRQQACALVTDAFGITSHTTSMAA
ncbi:hypothetical protein FHW69_002417 [Luteibacter sp. Sphag1AF]|uniref:DUF535 family protein n=1 Tax=Luteibacter sp. Sphag1AF TaxID=2587031 RepID=UPI00160F7E58|nr:hypothetical protein [Luteibacter sp. Sphag1AF]